MTNLEQIFEQSRQVLQQFMPAEAGVPTGLLLPAGAAVIGLVTAVLGAKLARAASTTAFVVIGGIAGAAAGESMGVSLALAGGIGAVVCGVFGFVLHRLWVGVAMFVLFAGIASGSMGYHRVLPHINSYAPSPPTVLLAKSPAELSTIQTVRAEKNCAGGLCGLAVNPAFEEWARDAWQAATMNDASLTRDLSLVTAAAGLFGFLMGMVAVRLTLVLVTSIVGTSLMLSGTGALLHQMQPDWYAAGTSHPQMIGIAWGVILLASMVLQGLLTRPEKRARKKAA